MPFFSRFTVLDWIDLVLIVAGGGILLVEVARWWHAGRQDPLRGAPIRSNVLSVAWLWLSLLCYALSILAANLIARLYHPAGPSPKELSLQQSILGGNLMQVFVILAAVWIVGQTFTAGLHGAGLGRRSLLPDLADAFKGYLAAFSLATAIAWLTETFIHLVRPAYEAPEHTVFEALNAPHTPWFIGFVAISGAFLLAPIGEELLFRCIFQTGLHRIMPPRRGSLQHRWVAILAASVIFGLMHWPLVQHIPALTVLAIILGYQYERTGSLLVPIFIHILFNGKSLLWHWLQPPS